MNEIYTHDEKGKRNDVHAPSVINPGDYEYVKVGVNRKDEIKGGPAGTCHHCGKAIVWEVVWKHLPTGNLVTFGETCTDILGMSNDRIEHEMVLLKRAAENERKKLKAEQQFEIRRAEFEVEQPKLNDFFLNMDVDFETSWFMKSLKWGYDRYGSLLPNQVTAALKVLEKREQELARKLTEDEAAPAPPLDDNNGLRMTLTGTIVKEKWQESYYDHVKAHKMIVKLDDGNKVFGSVPVEVERHSDEIVGLRVQFDAKVEISKKDENFGFFSRPTKAKVL